MTAMSKSEREDLQRLIRQREKVQKSAAKQRSAELLADFENQLTAEYRFDDDKIWKQAAALAQAAIASAQKTVSERCAELGIPKEFAPSLGLTWRHNGYRNGIPEQKAELRKVAATRIAAMEAAAVVAIEEASVAAQTELALAGVTGEAARTFVERLPHVRDLMQSLSFEELAGRASAPIASQLVAPSSLRDAPALQLAPGISA